MRRLLLVAAMLLASVVGCDQDEVAPEPVGKPSRVAEGIGSLQFAWLPSARALGLPAHAAAQTSYGEEAANAPLCGRGSLSSLGAKAALRGEFGPGTDPPRAAVVLAEFATRYEARRAKAVLTPWMADCATRSTLETRLLLVGRRIAVVEVSIEYVAAHGSDRLPRVMRLLSKDLAG